MKKLLVFAALSEGLTGLLLLVYPPLVIRLLLNSEVAGAGIIASRIAGASLIALSVACWPDRNMTQAFWGMFTYSLIATLYLGWVGIRGWVGILLWPAVAVHTILFALLVWARRRERSAPENKASA